jgi:magnesium transporter
MELYLSSASNRMNDTMKTLTLIATIFIPLTFVVGIYGMNFDYMPELHWRWGYTGVWAVMLVLGGGLYVWFRRRGFLDPGAED